MPEPAESGLQEPEHELAVVQQVQQGSVTAAGTKAKLTVKLPGELGGCTSKHLLTFEVL